VKIEQKYVFIAQLKEMIIEWAEYCCVRDPRYYYGPVSTLYFDTPGLHHYGEKRNSDYIKAKVRLRWYEDLDTRNRAGAVGCYIEAKQKQGISRHKKRKEVVISSERLCHDPFSDEEILGLPSMVYELDYLPPGILVPMLLIQYDRYRFVDPRSGSRIAIDTNIRCTGANPAFIPRVPPVYLDAGVLEVKGLHRDLPGSFDPIVAHLNREAFSKYGRCYEHLLQPLGRRL